MIFLKRVKRKMKIKEIYDFLNEIAPFETAAQWDNTGLCVGSLGKEVDKVILSLDVTTDVINKAEQTGAQLVLTHHPLIFDGIKNIEEDSLVYTAVKSGITFLSSHTCLDKATGGVNDCLANAVGIKNLCCSEIDEFLKIGDIEPSSAEDFANKIKKVLGGKVSFTDSGKTISKVALCSGSGGDLVFAAAQEGADAFLTGEAKHHEMLASKELGISLFAAGHYETENIVLDYLKKSLESEFEGLQVEIYSPAVIRHI